LQNLAPAGFSWPHDWQFTGPLPNLSPMRLKALLLL
jgi:hypothetical protein